MISLSTLLRQRRLYQKRLSRYYKGGSVRALVRARFPYVFSDPMAPRTVAIELTNVCNLKCVYCDAQNPALMRKPGFMAEGTFKTAIDQIRALRVQNVRLIGAGEATLHPLFPKFLRRALGAAPVMSLTTNGQFLNDTTCGAIVDTLDVVEVSVDSDHAAAYQRVRLGADFRRLLTNLEQLRNTAARRSRSLLLNIRLMLRPSDQGRQCQLVEFWQKHGDIVSTQRLVDYFGVGGDLFPAERDFRVFRRCGSVFKLADINWNGDVPLCDSSALQLGNPSGLLLGNITSTQLGDLWRSDLLKQYPAGSPEPRLRVCRAVPGMSLCVVLSIRSIATGSTGRRTSEGKARVFRNAVTHGLPARDAVL